MDGWTWDQSVNIEGLATAAAAVGAAFAYVADLIARRRRDRKQRRRGARGRMILELIQSRYEDGVSEREIRRYLTSGDPECAALRTRYDVDKHDDSNEFEQDLETHLVDLVFDRLIEVDQPDHYRLYGSHFIVRDRESRRRDEQRELADRERQAQERAAGEAAAAIRMSMGAELVHRLWREIEDPGTTAWTVRNLLRRLVDLGEVPDAGRLWAIVDAADDRRRPEILEAIAGFVSGSRF